MASDLRTHAIVLRRTNYGESDRILNFLTPEGKISALARGARKEKSRLAGGIELFSVADIVVHNGRASLATLTSAKMLKFYGNILSNITKVELASSFLKKLERASEQTDNPEYFSLLNQALSGLDANIPEKTVATWFDFNFLRATGEEINLYRDADGQDLSPELRYFWDPLEKALRPDQRGNIGAAEIKLARLLLTSKLRTIANISHIDLVLPQLRPICRHG